MDIEMYVERRWWLAAILFAGYFTVVASTVWLSLSLPGEDDALGRAALILLALVGCGYMALGVVRDFWIRLDSMAVRQPSVFGWKRIQWNEVVAVQTGHSRIVLRSDRHSIAINVSAFSRREELVAVLRQCLPPAVASQLESL